MKIISEKGQRIHQMSATCGKKSKIKFEDCLIVIVSSTKIINLWTMKNSPKSCVHWIPKNINGFTEKIPPCYSSKPYVVGKKRWTVFYTTAPLFMYDYNEFLNPFGFIAAPFFLQCSTSGCCTSCWVSCRCACNTGGGWTISRRTHNVGDCCRVYRERILYFIEFDWRNLNQYLSLTFLFLKLEKLVLISSYSPCPANSPMELVKIMVTGTITAMHRMPMMVANKVAYRRLHDVRPPAALLQIHR